ncbi:MAG: aminotransferase class I/II-fold pyridoxal phosphate-dependent enzyme [Alphaproteobacteria bacterium]|nr:aminotransferase class I/II-fold pyridoxal phosphate-dependent enzyme [Alphaproteobacteria bacterium]
MRAIDALGPYPFERLRQLLQDIPSTHESFDLTIGEPKVAPPALVARTIAAQDQDWNCYPPIPGTPELREAMHVWLCRRFALAGLATNFDVDPTCGSREGLFLLAMLTRFCAKSNNVQKSSRHNLIAMPNPSYAVYAGSARIAGAETLALDTVAGAFPTPDQLDVDILADLRLVYLCSPDNPSGNILPEATIRAWITAAYKHDFIVASDECYSELYAKTPLQGILAIAARMGTDQPFDHVVCLNSLSKRSSCAGLRSGLLAGDPKLIDMIRKIKSFAGNRMPLALQTTSIALWQDEDHVQIIRRHYQENYVLSNCLFADQPGFTPVQAGMFLWLRVNDDIEVTKHFWREGGLRVLPGRFLCEPEQIAPGKHFYPRCAGASCA